MEALDESPPDWSQYRPDEEPYYINELHIALTIGLVLACLLLPPLTRLVAAGIERIRAAR